MKYIYQSAAISFQEIIILIKTGEM